MEYDTKQRSLAEFIGSFALTFIGGGSVLTVGGLLGGEPLDILAIAIAHGLVLGIFVTALGHVSGAHFNPAGTPTSARASCSRSS